MLRLNKKALHGLPDQRYMSLVTVSAVNRVPETETHGEGDARRNPVDSTEGHGAVQQLKAVALTVAPGELVRDFFLVLQAVKGEAGKCQEKDDDER